MKFNGASWDDKPTKILFLYAYMEHLGRLWDYDLADSLSASSSCKVLITLTFEALRHCRPSLYPTFLLDGFERYRSILDGGVECPLISFEAMSAWRERRRHYSGGVFL